MPCWTSGWASVRFENARLAPVRGEVSSSTTPVQIAAVKRCLGRQEIAAMHIRPRGTPGMKGASAKVAHRFLGQSQWNSISQLPFICRLVNCASSALAEFANHAPPGGAKRVPSNENGVTSMISTIKRLASVALSCVHSGCYWFWQRSRRCCCSTARCRCTEPGRTIQPADPKYSLLPSITTYWAINWPSPPARWPRLHLAPRPPRWWFPRGLPSLAPPLHSSLRLCSTSTSLRAPLLPEQRTTSLLVLIAIP